MKGFKADNITIGPHLLGFKSTMDGDVDKRTFPLAAISGGKNMDFGNDGDRRRNPYILNESNIPTFSFLYEVVAYYQKKFSDNNGNSKECILIIVKDKTPGANKIRIYMKGYYSPDSTYDNYYGERAGFNDDLVELTETLGPLDWAHSGEPWVIGGKDYYYRAAGVWADHYFKGWSASSDSGATISRFVNDSVSSGGYSYFDIEPYALLTDVLVSRFPAGLLNAASFLDITKTYSFSEFANGLNIYQSGARIMNVQFIEAREIFEARLPTYSFSEPTHADWLSEINIVGGDYPTNLYIMCDVAASTVQFRYSFDNVVWSVFLAYTTMDGNLTHFYEINYGSIEFKISYTGGWHDDEYVHITFTDAIQPNWFGFYFDFDIVECGNKGNWISFVPTDLSGEAHAKTEEIPELGLGIKSWLYDCTPGEKDYNIYSLCVELDGFQTIFVKNIVSYSSSRFVENKIFLRKHLNRRITAILLFFGAYKQADIEFRLIASENRDIPPVFLLADTYPGYIVLSKLKCVSEADGCGYLLDEYWRWSDTGGIIGAEQAAISLNYYLNSMYWKTQRMECKGGFEFGSRNTLVYGVSDTIINADSEQNGKKTGITGSTAIAISNIQHTGVDVANCRSVFSTERILSVVKDEIIEAIPIVEYQFIVFTSTMCRWMNVSDMELFVIDEIGTFNDYGALSKDAIVKLTFVENAAMGTASWEFGAKEFGGIGFANNNSIYLFDKNKPVNLLFNEEKKESIWLNYYQSLDKTGLISGYFPLKKEMWFYLPVCNHIFIYSFIYGHWKIYDFSDVPKMFHHDSSGRITFSDGTNIYRMTEDREGLYEDKASTAIAFGYSTILNMKQPLLWKVMDRIDIASVMTLKTGSGLTGNIKIKVGSETDDDDLLTTTEQIDNNPFKKIYGFTTRTPNKFLNFSIESDASTVDNIKTFKIEFLNLLFKLFK